MPRIIVRVEAGPDSKDAVIEFSDDLRPVNAEIDTVVAAECRDEYGSVVLVPAGSVEEARAEADRCGGRAVIAVYVMVEVDRGEGGG